MANLTMSSISCTIILSLVFLFTSLPEYSAERVYLDITTTETKKIIITVPWYQNKLIPNQKQKLGRNLADTLAKALKFHGIFSIIPTSEYGGSQSANWARCKESKLNDKRCSKVVPFIGIFKQFIDFFN